jgi:PAS domain S-box-containing protein
MLNSAESRSVSGSAAVTDPQRLAALQQTGLLDSPCEEAFDRLTRLASRLLNAPVALVCLLDEHRQFFKSAWGLPEPWASRRETPLSHSVCQHALAGTEPLIITDSRQHPLMCESRAVSELGVIAYLGVPLFTSEGAALGAFCVTDSKPRTWSPGEIETLRDLTASVATEIELRTVRREFGRRLAESAAAWRQTYAARLESEQRLHLALVAARAGVWELDHASNRVYWSPELYEVMGLDPTTPPMEPDRFVAEVVHPDDRGTLQSAIAPLEAGELGKNFDQQFRIMRSDRTLVWIQALGRTERNAQDRPTRTLGICRDITEHKKTEEARREGDQFARKIAEVAPNIILVLDFDQGRRLYGNRRLSEALGYEAVRPGEFEREFLDRVIHPDDRARFQDFRRTVRALGDDGLATIEVRCRHADDTWRWLLIRSAVFGRRPDGTVHQVIATATDITELKRAEEELRRLNAELEQRVASRTAQLTAANRELEAFAYSVSHDLRTPLRAIDGFSRALLQDYAGQLDTQAQHYLARVRAAAQRMGELTDALLHLSRTTRAELSPQAVDLSALADSITAELRRADPERIVDVVIAPETATAGDARLLRIVLENLLGNAWKFTSKCDHARIEFATVGGSGERTWFVRDNGVGFDMANAAKLFGPFQRFHKAQEFPGTGIGLATVQRIITRHGGRIWAESARGRGATFYFTLASSTPSGAGAVEGG